MGGQKKYLWPQKKGGNTRALRAALGYCALKCSADETNKKISGLQCPLLVPFSLFFVFFTYLFSLFAFFSFHRNLHLGIIHPACLFFPPSSLSLCLLHKLLSWYFFLHRTIFRLGTPQGGIKLGLCCLLG